MKKILHSIYKKLGFILYSIHQSIFKIEIKIKPIKEKSILFVAHPDDDVLFFNRIMKTEKPYVVLATTGFSIIRIKEFKKAMKYYGLRYNYYSLESRDEREDKLLSIISSEIKNGNFEKCYSHSPSGEYGHIMHQRVGNAVGKAVKNCRIFTTVSADEIDRKENELSEKEKAEKINIFKTIYSSQDFVLDEYSVWVSHEKTEEFLK